MTHCLIARKLVIGKEHATNPGNGHTVVAGSLQCVVDLVFRIWSIVIFKEFDQRQLSHFKPPDGIRHTIAVEAQRRLSCGSACRIRKRFGVKERHEPLPDCKGHERVSHRVVVSFPVYEIAL